MSNPLSSGADLALTALITASAATCVVPAGTLLCSQLYEAQGDPGQQYDAAMAWFDLAGQYGDAVTRVEAINNAIPGAWRDDPAQEAFNNKVADYTRELMVGQIFAITVGVGLMVSAITMFVTIAVGLVLAIILAAWAAAIIAAVASVVGNLGASEALEVEATTYALDAFNSMKGLMAAVEAVDVGVAAEMGTFLTLDVVTQFAMGNHDVIGDLGQAAVDGIGTVATGLVAMVFQKAVSKGMRLPGIGNAGLRTLFRGLGLGDAATGGGLNELADNAFIGLVKPG